jgi:hypothetical protein
MEGLAGGRSFRTRPLLDYVGCVRTLFPPSREDPWTFLAFGVADMAHVSHVQG